MSPFISAHVYLMKNPLITSRVDQVLQTLMLAWVSPNEFLLGITWIDLEITPV